VCRDGTSDGSCRFNHKGASVITALSCGARHGIMSLIMRLLIVLLLVLPSAASSAATLTGRTVRVTDGDTIVILSEGDVQHKIRLQGIDAPERGQAYGTKSKEHLSEWVAGRFVIVETDKRDRYGRVVGKVLVGGKDVCLAQLIAGFACITRSTRTNKPQWIGNGMPMRNKKHVTRNAVFGKIHRR